MQLAQCRGTAAQTSAAQALVAMDVAVAINKLALPSAAAGNKFPLVLIKFLEVPLALGRTHARCFFLPTCGDVPWARACGSHATPAVPGGSGDQPDHVRAARCGEGSVNGNASRRAASSAGLGRFFSRRHERHRLGAAPLPVFPPTRNVWREPGRARLHSNCCGLCGGWARSGSTAAFSGSSDWVPCRRSRPNCASMCGL